MESFFSKQKIFLPVGYLECMHLALDPFSPYPVLFCYVGLSEMYHLTGLVIREFLTILSAFQCWENWKPNFRRVLAGEYKKDAD